MNNRLEKFDAKNKSKVKNERRDRSRSPRTSHSSYGITNRSFPNRKRSSPDGFSSKARGFIPEKEMKKFFDKSSDPSTGYWTSEDYTFRDTLAKDVRNEFDTDESEEEDAELAEFAERADMNDEEEKKTIVERIVGTEKKTNSNDDRLSSCQKTEEERVSASSMTIPR